MYLALDDLKSEAVVALVTDGQKHPVGSAGSEL